MKLIIEIEMAEDIPASIAVDRAVSVLEGYVTACRRAGKLRSVCIQQGLLRDPGDRVVGRARVVPGRLSPSSS